MNRRGIPVGTGPFPVPLRVLPYVAVYDAGAGVYEIFRDEDCDSYIGCADTIRDCEEIAAAHKAEEGC